MNKSTKNHRNRYELDIVGYRDDYNTTNFATYTDPSIEEICHDYLEGLQWVLTYYLKGVPNWLWNYKNRI